MSIVVSHPLKKSGVVFDPNTLSPNYFDNTVRTFTGSNFINTGIYNTPFLQTNFYLYEKLSVNNGLLDQYPMAVYQGSNNFRVYLNPTTNGSIRFITGTQNSQTSVVFSAGYNSHKVIKIVKEGSSIKIYVDGATVFDGTFAPTTFLENLTYTIYRGARNNQGTADLYFSGGSKGCFIKGSASALSAGDVTNLDTYFTNL